MYPQALVDIRNAAVGLCEALAHANPSTSQSKILRTLANAPWYVSNLQLHTDLGIPFVSTETYGSSLLYLSRLAGHRNTVVATLSMPTNVTRRLKRR